MKYTVLYNGKPMKQRVSASSLNEAADKFFSREFSRVPRHNLDRYFGARVVECNPDRISGVRYQTKAGDYISFLLGEKS